jgi:hypothetical protein
MSKNLSTESVGNSPQQIGVSYLQTEQMRLSLIFGVLFLSEKIEQNHKMQSPITRIKCQIKYEEKQNRKTN